MLVCFPGEEKENEGQGQKTTPVGRLVETLKGASGCLLFFLIIYSPFDLLIPPSLCLGARDPDPGRVK